jgi:uncharacterized membrane protein YjjB (DUF3815 family)
VNGVLDGTIGVAEGVARVGDIEAAPAPYPSLLIPPAFALSSAAAARFLGGGAREILSAGIAGVVLGSLALAADARPGLRRVFGPIAAFLAALLAGLLGHVLRPLSTYTVTLAALVVLLPGLTLATAMTEIASRHLAAGTARLSGALMEFLAIGFGVALGGTVVERALGAPAAATPAALAAWTEWVALALAPLGLMVLLRAPPGDAPWVLATCALAFAGGRLGAAALGPEMGIFLGSLTAGVASNAYARLLRRPAPVTLVPALLLLVPGSVGFRSLALMLRSDVLIGVEAAFRMTILLSALVAGLLIANVVVPASPRVTGVRPAG